MPRRREATEPQRCRTVRIFTNFAKPAGAVIWTRRRHWVRRLSHVGPPASKGTVCAGEFHSNRTRVPEALSRVGGEHRRLKPYFVDLGDAGLSEPVTQVGGLVVYPELRGHPLAVHP